MVAVTLVNCGQDDPDNATDTDAQTTSATAGPDPPRDDDANGNESDGDDNSGSNDSRGNGKGGAELAWVPIGPASPDIPDDQKWYVALVDHRCDQVGRDSTGTAKDKELLYRGLGNACAALFQNQTQRWDNAQQELTRALDQLAGNDLECHNLAAVALARRLLEFPDRLPRVRVTSTPGTVCEWGIEDIGPTEGPLEGGTELKIYGYGNGLYTATEVLFRGVSAKILERDTRDDSILVVSPPMTSPGEVQITVRGPAGSRSSDVLFEYLDGSEAPDGKTDDSDSEEPPPSEADPTPTSSDTTGETG
ncbi:IPT/TIG domain-containing protein [Flindersiella endophytica]